MLIMLFCALFVSTSIPVVGACPADVSENYVLPWVFRLPNSTGPFSYPSVVSIPPQRETTPETESVPSVEACPADVRESYVFAWVFRPPISTGPSNFLPVQCISPLPDTQQYQLYASYYLAALFIFPRRATSPESSARHVHLTGRWIPVLKINMERVSWLPHWIPTILACKFHARSPGNTRKLLGSVYCYVVCLSYLLLLAGDIHSNPGPGKLTVVNINVNSIKSDNKKLELSSFIRTHEPSVVCMTETKIDSEILTAELPLDDYDVFRRDRSSMGGGVIIATLKQLKAVLVEFSPESKAELIWVELQLASQHLIFGCFYRHISTDVDSLDWLKLSLDEVRGRYPTSKLSLCGDFNAPDLSWAASQDLSSLSVPSRLLRDILDDHALEQIVLSPTRGRAILDLVCVSHPSLVTDVEVVPGISDHNGVLVSLLPALPCHVISSSLRCAWSKANWSAFAEDLRALDSSFLKDCHLLSVNQNWQRLKAGLLQVMHTNVPTSTSGKRTGVNRRYNLPRATLRLSRQKRGLYNYANRTHNPRDWERFRQLRAKVSSLCRGHYKQQLTKLGDQLASNDPKPFWSYIKRYRQDAAGIPPIKHEGRRVDDSTEKASIFNAFFQSVYIKEDDVAPIPVMNESSLSNVPPNGMQAVDITEEGVLKILEHVNPNKSTGPDGLSARLIRESAPFIYRSVAMLFRQSLDHGEVPNDWKHATVQPVHKRGSKSSVEHYRPISLTCVLCKVMEHVICSELNRYFDRYGLIYQHQHGFRKKHSCEGQLISVTHSWTRAIDSGLSVDAFYLDFAKAFDTVPHRRLIYKLSKYKVDNKVLKWVEDFLKNRTQVVRIDGSLSSTSKVTSGVPQGSVIGPVLFLVYINDIASGISPQSKVHLFADDCLLHRVIRFSGDRDCLQHELDILHVWSLKWLLRFNVSKCQYLQVGSCSRKFDSNRLYRLGGAVIERTTAAKYLGVTMASNFKWDQHIDNVVGMSNKMIGLLRRNFRKAPRKVKKILYEVIVRSRLEYASSVWDPYYAKDIDKLEMCQRRGVRFIGNLPYGRAPVTETREQLGIPLLKDRRSQKRQALLRKYMQGDVAIPGIPPAQSDAPHLYYWPVMKLKITKNAFVHRTFDEYNELQRQNQVSNDGG